METCAVVKEVRVLGEYRLGLLFEDGLRGTVDLTALIVGRRGVFSALQDPGYFAQVRVDQELGTIVWPNGADFRPDVLHDWAKGVVFEPTV
jgi:hypothetical protein